MTRIFGMNDSVGSWICVAAWKIETSRPTIEPGDEERRRDLHRDHHRLQGEAGDGVLVHVLKEEMSDWITRCQPSTRTKSRILNGSEMRTGGSIIIPMDMSVAETIMSMIRNGR